MEQHPHFCAGCGEGLPQRKRGGLYCDPCAEGEVPWVGMSEREREMGMAHGNRGLADYSGLDLNPEGCLGHACYGCVECEG